MAILKFSKRRNLNYPLTFILMILVRKIDVILINEIYGFMNIFISPILVFLSQLIAGLIKILLSKKKEKKEQQITQKKINNNIELIENIAILPYTDSENKIFILIFFASFFNWVGVIIRNNINFITKYKSKLEANILNNIDNFIENRLRNIHIIISAILSCIILRIKIYKHQKLSIIIISICFIGIIIIELLELKPNTGKYYFSKKLRDTLLTFFSYLARSFLDVIEKYLFEYNYTDPFKILFHEGLIGLILSIFPYSIYWKRVKNEIIDLELRDNIGKTFLLIILSLLYTILSGIRNIYRLYTNKLYSPTTRALAESILDPLIVFYYIISFFILGPIKDKDLLTFLIIVIILLSIIGFFSLVYNDFIILYCFGLEKDTYKELTKRAVSQGQKILNEDYKDNEDSLEEYSSHRVTELELEPNNKVY